MQTIYIRGYLPGRTTPSWVRKDVVKKHHVRVVKPMQEASQKELGELARRERKGELCIL